MVEHALVPAFDEDAHRSAGDQRPQPQATFVQPARVLRIYGCGEAVRQSHLPEQFNRLQLGAEFIDKLGG